LLKQNTYDKNETKDSHSAVRPSVSNLIGRGEGADSIETGQSAVKIGCTDPDIPQGNGKFSYNTEYRRVLFSCG